MSAFLVILGVCFVAIVLAAYIEWRWPETKDWPRR